MKMVRVAVVALFLLVSGSSFAYDSFSVGLQVDAHRHYIGYNAHAVLPLAAFGADSTPRMLSARVDFSAGDVVYAGLAAVLSGRGPGIQPFVSLGGGAALWGTSPLPTFQGTVGVRMPLTGRLYATAQFQLRVATVGHAQPGFGLGLEYSF